MRDRVHKALDAWPQPAARRALLSLCNGVSPALVGHALARCGSGRRRAADAFLDRYQNDRRLSLRSVVLYARLRMYEEDPREFLREAKRMANLPGAKPWPAIMDSLNELWARHPREMFRIMPGWLSHRDPWRRWASLHGLEIPARNDPRAALKVLRLLRGERDLRVRRLMGHVVGQGLYLRHPTEALEEMARWLTDGAKSAGAVTRQAESQVRVWFESGLGSERQRIRLLRAARALDDHRRSAVRAHARRLIRILED